MWVGGSLVTKSMEGPSSFEAWEESWGLYAVAMISLRAASPGNLNAYHAGIKALTRLLPNRWGLIATADVINRTERWSRLREDFERQAPPGYSQAMPWDVVIGQSAFGREGANSSWWQLNLVLPASLGSSVPLNQGTSRSSAGNAPPNQKPPRANPPPPPRPPAAQGDASEVCLNWNRRLGACSGDGPCASHRRHVCSECGKSHRAIDHHTSQRANKRQNKYLKKGKGKGKGQE